MGEVQTVGLVIAALEEENIRLRKFVADVVGSLSLSASAIRLASGEMTAQEMRSVQAVLKWRQECIRRMVGELPEPKLPSRIATLLTALRLAHRHLEAGTYPDAARGVIEAALGEQG